MLKRSFAQRARVGAVAAVFAATGAGFLALGITRQEPAPPAVPASAAPADSQDVDSQSPVTAQGAGATPGRFGGDGPVSLPVTAPPLPASEPVRVRIPRLGVDADMTDLGLDGAGVLETPDNGAQVGWYDASPTPGSLGPSVLAGHVTWGHKPAAFFRLAELRPGDRVEVVRRDGTAAVFEVEGAGQYPKDAFPTAKVYGDLDYPGLRLITCAGQYDKDSARPYPDNVVVYARMVSAVPA